MKQLSKKKKHNGIIIDVYESHYELDGRTIPIEQQTHPGGVCVCAITEDNELLLVEQYRFGVDEYVLEFPAGLIEEDEDPKLTALRELQEETGYEASYIEDLGEFYLSPGYSNEIIHLFFAKDLKYVGTNFDENEVIETFKISLDKMKDDLDNHLIKDIKTAYLTQAVYHKINNG